MKILYLTPGCFDKGGISRYNRYQITACRELFGAGNVRVISLLGPAPDDFEDEFPVTWHGSGTGKISKVSMIRQVFMQALAWKPDIIMAAHVNLSGLACLAGNISRAKTVMNAYGLEVWSPMRRDAAWGLRKTNYIIADCHNTASFLVQHKKYRKENISVIWDCIDNSKFYPIPILSSEKLDKYGIPDPQKYFIILTLGRLSLPDALYKGYDRLIKIFSKISEKYDNARLVIAGRGNYVSELKKMAADLKLEDRICFTGSIEENDMATIYNCCSVFSLVTESGEGKGEGIPLTPLEAIACGKPIIVGNQDGSAEAVIEGNGYVVDPDDFEQQAGLIMGLMDDPILLKTFSDNAFRVSVKFFSYQEFTMKHLNFFNQFFPLQRNEK
jgi:phosphatidyl-myo-inositol dimannoside synthase